MVTAERPPAVRIPILDWARPLFDHYDFKVLLGGRGSGKNVQFAFVAVNDMLTIPDIEEFICAREHQANIGESVKMDIVDAIKIMNVEDKFEVQSHRIIHKENDNRMLFHGIEKRSDTSLKAWYRAKRLWIDEGEAIDPTKFRIIRRTIRRAGSEIWVSFNPKNAEDAVSQDFIESKPIGSHYIRKVNYTDNPFFPERLENERLQCFQDTPELYAHEWEGEYDTTGQGTHVIPMQLLKICVEMYDKYRDIGGYRHSGFDIADIGPDKSSVIIRVGPRVEYRESQNKDIDQSCAWAHELTEDNDCTRMVYDATGIGATARHLLPRTRRYKSVGINFGSTPEGKDRRYSPDMTNGEMFPNRKSQMSWGVRLRAQRTQRLYNGEGVDPAKCLFINPDIPNCNGYLAQLSQPTYYKSMTGKIVIEKVGKGERSPDEHDATGLAFARDSERGLQSR